jgi:hypothetical protein
MGIMEQMKKGRFWKVKTKKNKRNMMKMKKIKEKVMTKSQMRRLLKVIIPFLFLNVRHFNCPFLVDEFVTCGLDVWPCISAKEDRIERQFIAENTNDLLTNFLKSN